MRLSNLAKLPLGLAVVFWAPAAKAQDLARIMELSGNEVRSMCHSDDEHLQELCMIFTEFTAMSADGPYRGGGCITDDPEIPDSTRLIPRDQLRDVLVKYLDDNPELLHRNAWSLGIHAFTEAFPCKEVDQGS